VARPIIKHFAHVSTSAVDCLQPVWSIEQSVAVKRAYRHNTCINTRSEVRYAEKTDN
jgi:hypothetical protein